MACQIKTVKWGRYFLSPFVGAVVERRSTKRYVQCFANHMTRTTMALEIGLEAGGIGICWYPCIPCSVGCVRDTRGISYVLEDISE